MCSRTVWATLTTLGILVSASALLASVQSPPASGADRTTTSPAADDAKAGQELYARKCQRCHGPDGQGGNPRLEKMLGAKPKVLRSAEVQRTTDQEITAVIKSGKGKMPPVKGLTTIQIRQIVAHVRTFRARTVP